MGWYANQMKRHEDAKAKAVAEKELGALPALMAIQAAGIGLSVKEGVLKVKGQGEAPVAGLIARVESAGELESRVTVTRLLATGVFAFALKKKKDNRQLFLTIEGNDHQFLIEVKGDPKHQTFVRNLAAHINNFTAAAQA